MIKMELDIHNKCKLHSHNYIEDLEFAFHSSFFFDTAMDCFICIRQMYLCRCYKSSVVAIEQFITDSEVQMV